jgi:hypothetical protein
MMGICRERNILGIVHFHPPARSGIDCLADHGCRAIHRGNETKTKEQSKQN